MQQLSHQKIVRRGRCLGPLVGIDAKSALELLQRSTYTTYRR